VANVEELLEQAARGRIGVDRRLIRQIVETPDAAAGVLAFSRAPRDEHRIDLDPLLVDLLYHFRSSEALEFYIDAIRRSPEDIADDLVNALLPFGERAVDPLLSLYEELGEERGVDIAFLLAGLRVRDPRVLSLLLDRLEFDAGDGAFCLGLYGDPAARPALEKMLVEVPEEDAELRRELTHALEGLEAPEPRYEPESVDILAQYPERELPPFDLLPEEDRLEMLANADPLVRAGAAHSFFNASLNVKSRAALLAVAQNDPDAMARGRAWESLADANEDAAIRDAMVAVLSDASKPVDERGGAAVGLYSVADRDDVRRGLESLYEAGGYARAKALEAMWRSLYEPYAKYFPRHLDETDIRILREALRGAGYFQLTGYADKIASYFDRDEPYDKLREDALFAYALAMPGETTRGRVRGMLRKIDGLAGLTDFETELVEFALDERLRLAGLDPVFGAESEAEEEPEPPPPPKAGRNDPCPCGSGKKYKKCHGQ
jgi:SEC-C motif